MSRRNQKQVGSNLWDAKPQVGLCPMNCSNCYYNYLGESHDDVNEALIPEVEEVGDGIVRMNACHDSNIERELVIKTAKRYKNVFFNTSQAHFDFPGPVVFTANPQEEKRPNLLYSVPYKHNLMFIRFRVSVSNNDYVMDGIRHYALGLHVPVVLTFMRYYDDAAMNAVGSKLYTKKKHILNECWVMEQGYRRYVTRLMKDIGGRLVSSCGSHNSSYCRDCRNCETYYWQTMKHMREGV